MSTKSRGIRQHHPPAPGERSILIDRSGEMSVKEAARVVGCSHQFIRKAIHSGALKAYIPGGRTNLQRLGTGMGYRIRDVDLADWYYGRTKPAEDAG